MITKIDKSAIRQTLQSPQWKSVELVAEELISKWQNQSKRGDTEWETASKVMEDEGRCEGVRTLFQELLKQAQND